MEFLNLFYLLVLIWHCACHKFHINRVRTNAEIKRSLDRFVMKRMPIYTIPDTASGVIQRNIKPVIDNTDVSKTRNRRALLVPNRLDNTYPNYEEEPANIMYRDLNIIDKQLNTHNGSYNATHTILNELYDNLSNKNIDINSRQALANMILNPEDEYIASFDGRRSFMPRSEAEMNSDTRLSDNDYYDIPPPKADSEFSTDDSTPNYLYHMLEQQNVMVEKLLELIEQMERKGKKAEKPKTTPEFHMLLATYKDKKFSTVKPVTTARTVTDIFSRIDILNALKDNPQIAMILDAHKKRRAEYLKTAAP